VYRQVKTGCGNLVNFAVEICMICTINLSSWQRR
jgi:hypothetical protein